MAKTTRSSSSTSGRGAAIRPSRRPQLILHVGLPKTATKTLQVGFQTAPDLHYVHNPGTGRPHSRAFANYLGAGWDVLKTAEDHAPFRTAFLKGLRDSPHDLRIVSDETLSQIGKIDWDRFAALIGEVQGPVRILLVIRPFFSWLESLLIQFAKNGNMDFAAFDPAGTRVLNGYPLDFLAVHDAYTALARRIGSRARVECLPYSRDICATVGGHIGRAIISPDGEAHSHRSPSAFVALAEYASRKNMIDRLPLRPPARFIGRAEARALHDFHGGWMRELADRLGWDPARIDDYEAFSGQTGDFSYLGYARTHFAPDQPAGTSGKGEQNNGL